MAHRTTRKKYSSTTTISREDHELGQTTPWLRGRLRSKKIRLLAKQFIRTIRRKYFDYFTFNIVDCGVNCGLIRLGARRRALAQTIGNARGLDINSPLSVEAHTQDLQFRRYQQRDDPNNARGLDNNFASDRDCDSTTTTRLRHRRLRRADYAGPDKS
jgi:hypothetical protein